MQSQHPIVSGLSGRSNLAAEVVTFCTPADQTIVTSSGAGGSAALSRLVFIESWKQVNVWLNGLVKKIVERLGKLMSLPGSR